MDAATRPGSDTLRSTSPLSDLGPALRRLRMGKGRRQFETAEAAAITKAMLSAYENGKRRPSLKTLDQILAALEADLGELHLALVTERRERERADLRVSAPAAGGRGAGELGEPPSPYGSAGGGWLESVWRRGTPLDLYQALDLRVPLPAGEERALSEMLVGFLKLLRYLHAGGDEAAGGRPRRPFGF